MGIFDVLLSTDVLAGVVAIGSVAITVRSFLIYSKDASDLRPKLETIDKELKQLRESIGPKKKLVDQLSKEVAPVKEKEQKFSDYFEQLRELEIAEEKKEVQNAADEEANKRSKSQRRRMGFGGDESE